MTEPVSTASPVSTPALPALDALAQSTFLWEKFRALWSGILETAGTTFLLLIAVKQFQAGPNAKAAVAAGGNAGLLLTPMVVFLVARSGMRVAGAAALMSAFGALCFLVAALVPDVHFFVSGSVLGVLMTTASIPLLTQMYHDNYPALQRGRIFSRTFVIRILSAIVFSYAAGWLLEIDIGLYRWIILCFAIALAASSFCLYHCPSGTLPNDKTLRPFAGMRHVRDDITFRRTLMSWMLMGFANLMMVPMRVEFLANPQHGAAKSAAIVALLTGIVPNAARLVLSPVWGRLFDSMNFFTLRIILNIGFAFGALAFFTGDSMAGLVIGAIIFGVSMAGGDIAWNLWVTKMAPPEHVAEYMSMHTFFTGIRGVLAPIVAFQCLQTISFATLSLGCAVLMVIACVLLIPEMLAARQTRMNGVAPMVDEASE